MFFFLFSSKLFSISYFHLINNHTKNTSFNSQYFHLVFAKGCSAFVIIPMDGLKKNTSPSSSSVLLLVRGESDADMLCKCLEIKMLTLLIDGESLWVYTWELIKLSVRHSATVYL